jgi:hypothetical protein
MHESALAESQVEGSSPEELNVLFEEIASVVEISTRKYAPLLRKEQNAEPLTKSNLHKIPENVNV